MLGAPVLKALYRILSGVSRPSSSGALLGPSASVAMRTSASATLRRPPPTYCWLRKHILESPFSHSADAMPQRHSIRQHYPRSKGLHAAVPALHVAGRYLKIPCKQMTSGVWMRSASQRAGGCVSRGAVVCGVTLPHHVSIRHNEVDPKARDGFGDANLVEGQRPCCLAPFLQRACFGRVQLPSHLNPHSHIAHNAYSLTSIRTGEVVHMDEGRRCIA